MRRFAPKPLTTGLAGRMPALLVMVAAGASAQTVPDQPGNDGGIPGRGFSITPSFTASQTITDNATLGTGDLKRSGTVTDLSPGLHVRSTGGRFTGFLDYTLDGLIYTNGLQSTQLLNSLNAAGTAEAIENFAYVDVKATVAQQAISAFGTQSFDPTLQNGNRTEVGTYSLSPYVRGVLGGTANYEIRLTRSGTKSDDRAAGFDSTTTMGQASFSGGTAFSKLNWSFDASRVITSYGANGQTQDTQGQVGLNYALTTDIKVSANGGYESENLTGTSFQTGATYGGGLEWHPTERTNFVGSIEHRLFGNSHVLRFEHRTPRTAFSISDTRDVVTGNGQPFAASLGNAFDVFFQQFASQYPNPIQRQQVVLAFLQQNGISPSQALFANFLSNSVSLQHNQSVSFAWLGVRDTLTFLAARTEATQLQSLSSGGDSFDQSTVIRQIGFSADWSHRLTPQQSVNLTLQQQRTTGLSADLGSTLRSVLVNWTNQLGPKTSVSLGARHAESRGKISPYYETALIGSLRIEF
jgi:uncharacterized protein (PEP-CTERM system associated)